MPEQITFTGPISPALPVVFRVAAVHLDDFNDQVMVELREWSGTAWGTYTEQCAITGPNAQTLLNQLNTANMTIKSLHKRALEWALAQLKAEGRVADGTISGTP